MKSAVCVLFLILFFQGVNSQILFTDDFNYPVRDSLEGVGGWFRSGLNSSFNVKVATPGLTYSGYAGSGIGNSVLISNNPNGDIVLNNFTTQTAGTLYMSFMIRVDSMSQTATQGYNIGFDQSGGSTNLNTTLHLQKVTGATFRMGIAKVSGVSYASPTYNTNTTYLVVLKYSFVPGAGNDSSKIYIFSSGIPSSEPVVPAAFSTVGNDLADQGQVFLSNLYAQGPPSLTNSPVRIDGIRIGTSWLGVIFTSVIQTSTSTPNGYYLGQNYPNPFNPETNIYFSIPVSSNVRLTVSDITGREIAMLVDEALNSGVYKVSFDGTNLSSGTYFYKLSTSAVDQNTGESYVGVKRMVLIK